MRMMQLRRLPLLIVFLTCCAIAVSAVVFGFRRDQVAVAAKDHDIVILQGRVIDPESKLDAVRNIGISAGKIQTMKGSSSGSESITRICCGLKPAND